MSAPQPTKHPEPRTSEIWDHSGQRGPNTRHRSSGETESLEKLPFGRNRTHGDLKGSVLGTYANARGRSQDSEARGQGGGSPCTVTPGAAKNWYFGLRQMSGPTLKQTTKNLFNLTIGRNFINPIIKSNEGLSSRKAPSLHRIMSRISLRTQSHYSYMFSW